MPKTTNHARDRMKERCGFNKSSIDRMAKIAYNKGLRHKDCGGRLNKYITNIYFEYETANQIRIYGDKVYLFKDELLITVFNLPNNLKDIANKTRRKDD